MYYNRLHQEKDWEALLLGEHARDRQASTCAVLPPSVSIMKPTKEGENLESEGGCTAQELALIAQGVQRNMYDKTRCPSCDQTMQQEAAYRCRKCTLTHHVRCMGQHTAVGHRTWTYKNLCYICNMATTLRSEKQKDRDSSDTAACTSRNIQHRDWAAGQTGPEGHQHHSSTGQQQQKRQADTDLGGEPKRRFGAVAGRQPGDVREGTGEHPTDREDEDSTKDREGEREVSQAVEGADQRSSRTEVAASGRHVEQHLGQPGQQPDIIIDIMGVCL
jgi:hypothetical protein